MPPLKLLEFSFIQDHYVYLRTEIPRDKSHILVPTPGPQISLSGQSVFHNYSPFDAFQRTSEGGGAEFRRAVWHRGGLGQRRQRGFGWRRWDGGERRGDRRRGEHHRLQRLREHFSAAAQGAQPDAADGGRALPGAHVRIGVRVQLPPVSSPAADAKAGKFRSKTTGI